MGYDLHPTNADAGGFHFGAFSFPILLEHCGLLWPVQMQAGRWFCAFGVDPRMPQGDNYPRLISMDGFPVTEEEARIMARVARNLVAVQRLLPETNKVGDMRDKATFTRPDVEEALKRAMRHDLPADPWPAKIRGDFVDQFEAFAAWAERSGGFEIH
jgi:hypothetical protein